LLGKLPSKASGYKAVLFLRQLAFSHRYQQLTCPSPVSYEHPLASSAQVVGLCILFNPLNAELNPICHLLALLHFFCGYLL
jgi:hypothetical protein